MTQSMPLSVYYRAFAAIIAGITLTSEAQTNSQPASTQWPVLFDSYLQIESPKLALPEVHLQETNSVLPSINPPGGTGILPVGFHETNGRDARATTSVESKTSEQKIQLSDSFAPIGGRDDFGFNMGNHGLGLIQPPEPLPHDALSRGSDAIFKPEVFHIGQKATISCSILTAIKRKDPLCLLGIHPFLKITW